MALAPVIYNREKWISENEKYFLPPVCNKMMHQDGQMKVFFVGGPNQRKDYHIEEGEELFYMVKGDMCLKVIEHGKHRDVPIKEGEIFLLPGRVAHSPQRQENTIGLVIERERAESEKDGLRYFQEKDGVPTTDSLYEEWFHCTDLGTQLAPVIKRYFASEQFKTGKPIPGTIPENPPVVLDDKISLQNPFNFHSWIERNRSEINQKGFIQLFGDTYQFQVRVYGQGENTDQCEHAETWIWQIEGESSVTVGDALYTLKENDTMLIRAGQTYTSKRSENSIALICFQDPAKKKAQ
ncbi:3-hydroxyanthranilate 3,4-dioxygenase [Aplysia californica]|uniref:3-hydroxyanthranilate 3,4-dioxygenase n=1 Tax=Aplysia californica TaxID=6500 RepID=A0ABM0JW77_APLCA|nr:3-hydroxyanthranilate 3,4-dioxygenase [Aplysia californica]XP_005102961.1 3-hydroxyanthranilate 3,4-dioxygenase [Aplysia californica]XP_035826844.1 3-hydroxyanthranilate 3,4-dioxygenase [Aplysia californica]